MTVLSHVADYKIKVIAKSFLPDAQEEQEDLEYLERLEQKGTSAI